MYLPQRSNILRPVPLLGVLLGEVGGVVERVTSRLDAQRLLQVNGLRDRWGKSIVGERLKDPLVCLQKPLALRYLNDDAGCGLGRARRTQLQVEIAVVVLQLHPPQVPFQ